MKYKVATESPKFTPVKLELTFESNEDLERFIRILEDPSYILLEDIKEDQYLIGSLKRFL